MQLHEIYAKAVTGYVQDLAMQIQGVSTDLSRTKIKIFKEFYTEIHSACACVNNRKLTMQKKRHILAYQECSCTISFKL